MYTGRSLLRFGINGKQGSPERKRYAMSGELTRIQDAMIMRRDPLALRLPARVLRAIDREAAWGLTAAARAQAAGFAADALVDAVEMVTEHALAAVERLNHLEASMAKADPVKAERDTAVVDDFVVIARNELRRLPRES